MPLRIPKYAQIDNFRLSMFYRTMQVGIVLPLVAYFFVAEQYSLGISLKNEIFTSQTVRGWANPTVLATVAAEKMAQPWCKTPADFDFVGDFLGEYDFLNDYDFRFVGGKCAKVCSQATVASGQSCLHPPETWMQESKDSLLLLTSVRDTFYEDNGTSTSEALLLPFADYLSVAFKLSYGELDKTLFKVGHEARQKNRYCILF